MEQASNNSLTFENVDALAFAAERGRLEELTTEIRFSPSAFGPLFEHLHLSACGLFPPFHDNPWLKSDGINLMMTALANGQSVWICPHSKQCGFMRVGAISSQDYTAWVSYRLAAQKAAVSVGFPKKIAVQLIGALGEMQSNIEEHSGAPDTGLTAFKAIPGRFEFIIADRGMGVLSSLQSNPPFKDISDHGDALMMALTEGYSRFGSHIGRGTGFRPLFIGLANLRGSLRFRTGDHALTIDGYHPTLMKAKTVQKARIDGLFASVSCSL